jgi:hypothetical protein
MRRIIPLFFLGAGAAVWALPDATPSPARLELTLGNTGLRGGAYKLELYRVDLGRDRLARASVRITKEDPDHGLLSLEQGVIVGESLGWSGKPDLASRSRFPGKTLHNLLEGSVPVEFDPQAKLISARQYPDWPIRRCHLVSLPDGLGCVESVEQRAPVPVNEIVLQEKSGRRITIRAPSPSDKMPADELCFVHGGRVRARLLTEPEKNGLRAQHQLSEADEGWKSKNPQLRKRAQAAYFKLLMDYPSEAVVEKNRERIRARSEAEVED